MKQTPSTPLLKLGAVAVAACALALGTAACGGKDGGNGVNDVKLACEARNAWTQSEGEACKACLISAYTSGECDCKRDEYRALCHEQLVTRNAEVDCVYEVDLCVSACKGDCACADSCFDNHAKCKPLQAAYDGFLADVCEDACK